MQLLGLKETLAERTFESRIQIMFEPFEDEVQRLRHYSASFPAGSLPPTPPAPYYIMCSCIARYIALVGTLEPQNATGAVTVL